MKGVIICLFAALFISCGSVGHKTNEESVALPDTVYIEVPTLNEERIKELEADVAYWKDSVQVMNNTIPFDVYMNARKIEKIKYYINITERNSNNRKFFYGWIRRTMAE